MARPRDALVQTDTLRQQHLLYTSWPLFLNLHTKKINFLTDGFLFLYRKFFPPPGFFLFLVLGYHRCVTLLLFLGTCTFEKDTARCVNIDGRGVGLSYPAMSIYPVANRQCTMICTDRNSWAEQYIFRQLTGYYVGGLKHQQLVDH